MCIAIVFSPGCDVIKFEINLIFLIKPFFYKTKNSRQKFKYLEKVKSFKGKIILRSKSYKERGVIRNAWECVSFALELVDDGMFKYYSFY